MKFRLSFVLLIVTLLLIVSCQESENLINPTVPNSQNSSLQKTSNIDNVIPGQYIVVLKNSVSHVPEVANEMAKLHTATVGHLYKNSIKGFSAKMSAQAASKLANDPNVKFIEQDRIITLAPQFQTNGKPAPTPTPQVTLWGVTRVGGGATYTGNNVAWIIDTGVDLDNPDLNVDVSRSVSFVSRSKSADDDNGHGTHVAGTIAAIDNDIYVIGVAAGATVVAVKVLDRRGSGSYSQVIAGVDYVAANGSPGDVANMSLGGPVSQALDDAVLAASANVNFSLAAGNETDDANNHSPARVNGSNIYTISAIDSNDVFAYFSNFGNPPVDYAAPGVSILSLKKGGGTITYSGTSMAAPHVAGLLLLGAVRTDNFAISDPDGNPDPIAHN